MSTLDGNENYRAFMDRLAETNVDRHLDLPMIAVMGDTSSGKSSLLSSIAVIELPSSDELTTRCPIMLKMSRAEHKSATVEVKWKDKPAGKTDAELEFESKSANEKNWDSSLTDFIAQAQAHVVKKTGKEVARDVVSVKIAGPHCEDLTLIDLPGIVRSTGKGESATLAQDIQGLIDDYLKNSRCVILAVHPSNVDFHNSQIMSDALKVDPNTNRTLPVLTKPDLIDKGAEANVKDLLLGEKTAEFKRGFHMVKGRGQKSLNDNVSIENGLKEEEAFFRLTQPWRDIPDRALFGTQELRRKLGELQMQLIRETFPDIIRELREQKDKTSEDIRLFGTTPDSLAEKRLFFFEFRDRFVTAIRSSLEGHNIRASISTQDLEQASSAAFHKACKKYRGELGGGRLAKVSFVDIGVKVIASDGGKEVRGEVVDIDDDDDVYLKNYGTKHNGFCGGKSGHLSWHEGNELRMTSKPGKEYIILKPLKQAKIRRDPEWIQDLIERFQPYKLPIFPNSNVFESIVASCIDEDWQKPCLDLVDCTSKIVQEAAVSLISLDQKLSRFPRLREFLLRHVQGVVEQMVASVHLKVKDFLDREKIPYTQDHYLFENLCKERTKYLQVALRDALGINSGFDSSHSVSKSTIDSAIGMVFDHNQKKSVDKHMAEEMQHALDAYGKVAMKRFIDVVPMYCSEVLLGFADEMNHTLISISDDVLNKLVNVSHNDLSKQKSLKRKLSDLEEGLKIFDNLVLYN